MENLTKQPSVKAPAEMFTGDAWFEVIVRGESPSRLRVNVVRFAPGARNAWHATRSGRPCEPQNGEELSPMWTDDELRTIGQAEELDLASRRRDGTLRHPVTMWVVRDGDDLYVRSMNGRSGAWFRGTQTRHEGHIRAAGVDKDVTFADADSSVSDRLDDAYRSKYRRYGANVVGGVVNPESRAATIKLVSP
jgi:hypothetical protein